MPAAQLWAMPRVLSASGPVEGWPSFQERAVAQAVAVTLAAFLQMRKGCRGGAAAASPAAATLAFLQGADGGAGQRRSSGGFPAVAEGLSGRDSGRAVGRR